jgi:hypothetical protein
MSSLVALRNTGLLEFPFHAFVSGDGGKNPETMHGGLRQRTCTIQGGALRTFAFDGFVCSCNVFLETDGRPLKARYVRFEQLCGESL